MYHEKEIEKKLIENKELINEILGIRADSYFIEEKKVYPLKQVGWNGGKQVFSNYYLENPYINLYELIFSYILEFVKEKNYPILIDWKTDLIDIICIVQDTKSLIEQIKKV